MVTLTHALRDRRGVSAVEFALLLPIFATLLLGIVAFGQLIGTRHALQQLAAESARASIAGLDDAERARIAQAYIAANAPAYALIEGDRLSVKVTAVPPPQSVTAVALVYDMSGTAIYRLAGLLPLPEPTIRTAAAIQRGGY